ncbi:MAG TPA: M23 family metallopeptidase [Chthoniobacterales bacterium]|nr:M23 family metallopeptidase [Chthoniobacterales bacterium]
MATGAEIRHDVVDLALPTDNDALFHGGGPAFYQAIERNYRGVKSTPWEGGQYGFVREPLQTARGIVYTRFHEGIDIRPWQRDARGEPLDTVRAIAGGEVVYVNLAPTHSDYGMYIVIEHRWDGSSYYSLYAHLRAANVRAGQEVARGEQIAAMGYTGTGINQQRAHLHLELNLMLSRHFESWYETFRKEEPNYHGLYNGINLKGMDIARLYLALKRQPSLTIPEFMADEEIFYKVALPNSTHFDLLELYPWLLREPTRTDIGSWEVSFARSGLPLAVQARAQAVAQPQLTWVKPATIDYRSLTQDYVAGRGKGAHLTKRGAELMQLLIWPR